MAQVFVVNLIIIGVLWLSVTSWNSVHRSNQVESGRYEQARQGFWKQALGQKPVEKNVVGKFAAAIHPYTVLSPKEKEANADNAGKANALGVQSLPPELGRTVPKHQFDGLSDRLGTYYVFADGGDSGALSQEFGDDLKLVRSGKAEQVLTKFDPKAPTYPNRARWPWGIWLLLLGASSTLAFGWAWDDYNEGKRNGRWGYETEYDERGNLKVKTRKDGTTIAKKPRLELFNLSEHPFSKVGIIALSPHMALIYSCLNHELGLHMPVKLSVARRRIATNAKVGYLVALKRPVPETLLRAKKPDPRTIFAEQRNEVARLKDELDKIPAEQRALPEVVKAWEQVHKLSQVYDGLPKLVDDNAAKILALQVLSQVDPLSEAPKSFIESQKEVYEAEIERLRAAASRSLTAGDEDE